VSVTIWELGATREQARPRVSGRLAVFLAVAVVFAPGFYGSAGRTPAARGVPIVTRIFLPTFDEAAIPTRDHVVAHLHTKSHQHGHASIPYRRPMGLPPRPAAVRSEILIPAAQPYARYGHAITKRGPPAPLF
jgi:hypothetical protein